ncbi:hypothetical protein HDV00_008344 [Rhizophlyctis rosea]|nr:hypothetical protein HDV00_008344 [Rhizophlyctis rosea]
MAVRGESSELLSTPAPIRPRRALPAARRSWFNIYPDDLEQLSCWKLFRIYVWEWVACILLAVAGALIELVPPYERVAFGSDSGIAYPLINQTVPTWLLGVITVPIPVIVILLVSCFLGRLPRNYDIQTSLLGLATSLTFTLLFTQIIKVSVGGLRPDFLARCDPIYDPTDKILYRVVECRGDPGDIKEGRKSFFSGHSSFSHASLVYLSLYLSRHLNFAKPPIALKYILCLIPIIVATLIAISRVDNYWHRWPDVVVGGIVGYIVAIVSYKYHNVPSHPGAMGETDSLVGSDEEEQRKKVEELAVGGASPTGAYGVQSVVQTGGRGGKGPAEGEVWIPMEGSGSTDTAAGSRKELDES